MPSVQKCADRLREQAYKTLTPQIQALEEELRGVSDALATGVRELGYKLDALRNIELPATTPVLDDYLQSAVERRDLEGSSLARFTRLASRQETQGEILASLLDAAAEYSPKVALYTARGGGFKGWSSRGFSAEATRSIGTGGFALADAPGLAEALGGKQAADTAGQAQTGQNDGGAGKIDVLPEALAPVGRDSQGPWHVFPLRVLGRPVAFLLAGENKTGEREELADFPSRPQALAVITDFTALRLENLALKILKNLRDAAPKPPAPKPPASKAAKTAPHPAAVPDRLVSEPSAEPSAAPEAPTPTFLAEAVPETPAAPSLETAPVPEAAPDVPEIPLKAPEAEPVKVLAVEVELPVEPSSIVEPSPMQEALENGTIPLDLTRAIPVKPASQSDGTPVVHAPLPEVAIELGGLTSPIELPKPAAPPVVYRVAAFVPNPLAGLSLVPAPAAPAPPAAPPVEVPLKLIEEVVAATVAALPAPPATPAPPAIPPAPATVAPPPAAEPVAEPAVKAVEAKPEVEKEAAAPVAAPAPAVPTQTAPAHQTAPTQTTPEAAVPVDANGVPRRRRSDATQALPLTGPEEEKLHSAAKRFAKLLVSEIKLYNENTVAEGRKNRDIYVRLHREIDKSRDMYEKRVAPTVASKVDYFHDEIVRILGDNDADTLGGNYPGPRLSR